MYVCGVTTYDFSHIGTARAFVTFDILYRIWLPHQPTVGLWDSNFVSGLLWWVLHFCLSELTYKTSRTGDRTLNPTPALYKTSTLQDCQDALSSSREGSADTAGGNKVHITDAANECIHNLQNDVKKMSCDLHTYSLLNSALPKALKLINSSLTLVKKKQQQKQKQSVIQSLIELEKEVRDALDILGLLSKLEYSELPKKL
ncbi:cysteine--tRNA ligase 2, cytoplasmic [Daucus carota subsp. sativus]|uniref:cysteine--tRNA ligase 2, cytoplasmic n=1 Tax=Daucus carota subsp. sativus TaxID=79200 RepID=UPI0007EFA7B4|nr:PREDICTED: cysteine--tRNA ligase 2, cytoplasmic-like isoform X1 [Daucus carota subsp. sativus]